LAEIGECLVEGADAAESAAVGVYELVARLVEGSEKLGRQWRSIAERRPVYRTFRERQGTVTCGELFIGDNEYKEDLSEMLVCLKGSGAPPAGIIAYYRGLGVEERPTIRQVVRALETLSGQGREAGVSYGRLISALRRLTGKEDTGLVDAPLGGIRVLTCAGTYEPVTGCYWDEDLGQGGRVVKEHCSLLIDGTDKATQALVEWLRGRQGDVVVSLRTIGTFEAAEEPPKVAMTPEVSYLLLPWRQWFQEAAREGSLLREELGRLELAPPLGAMAIVPVESLRVLCRLQGGREVEQSKTWEGPLALASGRDRMYVRVGGRKPEYQATYERIRSMDTAIAREVAYLLGGDAVAGRLGWYVEGLIATLERPTTVLRRLRDSYRQHFLHQYHDQVADPESDELFHEYQRTSRSTKRGEERALELEQQMFALLEERFVRARREQIKGYGYSEFSVFAELLQNAEDAYLQREQLGMEMATPCGVVYRYVKEGETGRVLEVEHEGRPFNYWQHGPRQDRSFSKDVEGVLRSAGSFKPHAAAVGQTEAKAKAIGRFGLGFKSVYLITDCPEIHSGAWHFAIESGCLPRELLPPENLAEDVTRIRLPLRDDAEDLKEAAQLVGLLPFLGMTTQIEFVPLTGDKATLAVKAERLEGPQGGIVELVEISGPGVVRGDAVRLVRCRSGAHAGQLGLLLSQDGTPARWGEVFAQDLYAALPLQARLGCGVAASHRFEVQSGRTHLVDPKGNMERIAEVATLLGGVVEGLCATASADTPLSELLRRFWGVWHWDRGDAECSALGRALASELVRLAGVMKIVPTLNPAKPTSLGQSPRFYFWELPDVFRDAIVDAQVVVQGSGQPATALAPEKVVVEGFATCYRRTCEYVGVTDGEAVVGIGWAEVAAAFQAKAWLAERPGLLTCLAGCLNEDQSRRAGRWLALCRVLGEDGNGKPIKALPGELLPSEFPGVEHLPRRFLRCVSKEYDAASVSLLRCAGLPPQPSADQIREWVQSKNLRSSEAVDILKYLADASRFMEYHELAEVFRAPWFPGRGGRLSTKEAARQELIPDEVLRDEVFRAWLGVVEEREPEPQPPPGPHYDARQVLERLFGWWQAEGRSWTRRYEGRLYPSGRPPALRESFAARDLGERREWMTLLLLASMHTIGRTRLEQHRDFLRRCDDKNWLDVFADGEHDARRWMDVLESYLDDPVGNHDYYQWMKQFVVVFQLSRWLPEYVEAFLQINRITRKFGLDEIIAPRTSALFSGGGPDAPVLTRTLGIGACFALRELTRLRILHQPLAHRYCYLPGARVCAITEMIGCPNLQLLPPADRSSGIHQHIVSHLGENRATFDLGFDLPFLALAEDVDVQVAVLGEALPAGMEGASSGMRSEDGDVIFRTHPLGYVYPIKV
jgi:hypothetical protein